ncbi:Metallo-dependent phosphatase [Coniochaeta ligniaria NRRL 30616]|uniref:Metallo-dependent phosphatase n=1 Tax=Coniochaeta ligniaria NRRL 30616 TaxID=1408157 RepID=A0A1J7J149_9PEZI|nr:Metallo-dependent phosphatase [Coniochaeta ligniaria NRRL 30616]
MDIKTRFLIISDTHAEDFFIPDLPVDVAIHCGDLTEGSKMDEFRQSLDLLKGINAPLKLVIAGNHDFTLDHAMFKTIYHNTHSQPSIWSEAYAAAPQDYGYVGQAKRLFSDRVPEWEKAFRTALGGEEFNNNDNNIHLLGVGRHDFVLKNGAKLRVYADPYTPSASGQGGFKFRRDERREYAIGGPDDVDVVITHGPPRGVLDLTESKQRGGCNHLFAAVAKARPRLHCFGHIHEGWGAKLVAWRGEEATEDPSHFSDIDNADSTLVESLATLKPGKWDSPQAAHDKKKEFQRLVQEGFRGTSHRSDDEHPLTPGHHTLFVNAALEALEDGQVQLPWVVDIEFPRAKA